MGTRRAHLSNICDWKGEGSVKRILFVCGSGGITSTVAENYVVEACKERGVQIQSKRCSPMEVDNNVGSVDLIVSTTTLSSDYSVPVVSGISLIMGFGKEKVIDEIIEKLG